MFSNYLKVAIRTLRKNKLISFINIFGLGLSMSLGLILMIRLQDALSYDNFHPLGKRIVRVTSRFTKKTGEAWQLASTPLPLYTWLQQGVRSAEKAVMVYPTLHGKASANGKELSLNGAFTESTFFQVFAFDLSAGNAATVLQQPNTIVLSSNTAEKFFGSSNAIGKMVVMEDGSSYLVTGVMKPLPGKSHLQMDAYAAYASSSNLQKVNKLMARPEEWFSLTAAYTYVLLKPGMDAAALESELRSFSAGLNKQNDQGATSFNTQALAAITPGSETLYNDNTGSSWGKFYFEMGAVFIILLAACFNYTNLTTARALTRAKEVGIRKVNGATRRQLFVQYITESMLLAFLALGFAWVLLNFIIQYAFFNDGYEFIPSSFHYNLLIIGWSLLFAVFTGLLAGSAPAWILSSFQPVRVLKNLSTAKIFGKVSIQKTLIVFQYALSLIVIIFLFAFYSQFAHLASTDPGFKKENVLVLPLNGVDAGLAASKVAAVSGVQSVGAMSASLGARFNSQSMPVWTVSKKEAVNVHYLYANAAFIKNMELQVLAGQHFTNEDGSARQNIVLNEQAALALGYKDYNKAIGQQVWINDSARLTVNGIIKNFNFENAGIPIKPFAFRNNKKALTYLYITAVATDKKAVINRIATALQGMAPGQPFTASWLNEDLAAAYSQRATISLLGYIAFMVIAIATLGLTGLVIYTVEVKRKEISIRKILGAQKGQIVQILSSGFVRLLLIAGCIAIPVGYTGGYFFLMNFSNRASFGIGAPLACFGLILVVGLVTIVSQTWRAASANPVKDMRNE
ncbi:MAG TPA: ABC transporter permease [Chitinophagaceae bacterium]|nr:ABC transporter permease [Chitinophagaceae bacterium]